MSQRPNAARTSRLIAELSLTNPLAGLACHALQCTDMDACITAAELEALVGRKAVEQTTLYRSRQRIEAIDALATFAASDAVKAWPPAIRVLVDDAVKRAATLDPRTAAERILDRGLADDSFACLGCGCLPGDGKTPGCGHPDGCGYVG